MNVPLHIAVPVVVLTALASYTDVRSRRVPNALTGAAIVLGLVIHGLTGGWSGLGIAFAGAVLCGGLLLPGWLWGWMGAGDVKLMAAVGAWLGVADGTLATLLTLVAGGVIALVVAIRRGVLRESLVGAAMLARWVFERQVGTSVTRPATSGIHFPFALAAFIGAVCAMWVPA